MILITTRLATKELDQIEQVKDMLWTYRKKGLSVEGEMGVPNLVFKTLRNSGVTEMLLKAVSTLRDRDLSLENQPNN
jgi:predicted naringenin-chalcone synthase